MGQEKKCLVAISIVDGRCKQVSFVKQVKETELIRLQNEEKEYEEHLQSFRVGIIKELDELNNEIKLLKQEIKHLKGED